MNLIQYRSSNTGKDGLRGGMIEPTTAAAQQ